MAKMNPIQVQKAGLMVISPIFISNCCLEPARKCAFLLILSTVFSHLGLTCQLANSSYSKLQWFILFEEAMDAKRRKALQGMKAASRGHPEEEEKNKESLS